ncbi:hypothetical protein QBC37DRAFT_391026 [Rhypophila decipiens]|uniref:Heterokaryon incompatibility domain-containing protein n=1 Tax=Rhypophila decipiens TaxID=261697 RepID=A0AAN7B4K1_9PEZI|nr:hypothetical protein QBC37DRAFT_391026 [Rhypophila decipiens]
MSEQKPCRACDHPRKDGGSSTAVRSSWTAMKAQASLGCVTCGILSEGVERVLQDNQPQTDDNGDWQLRLDFNIQGTKSLNILVLGTDIVVSFFRSEATPWLSKTFPNIPDGFEVPPRTSSPEGLNWVRQQLQECERAHRRAGCSDLKLELLSFPMRVIDVKATPIRLYEPGAGRLTSRYICLSHVWGERPFLQTTSETIASHKKEIAYDKLPLTFQEAINYTRELGVSYLWIDSLCIIQNDERDWRDHAAPSSTQSTAAESQLSHSLRHSQMVARNTNPKSYYSSSAWRAEDSPDSITSRWHHLVEEYTPLNLTFEKDIFPALSGLATQMATCTDLNRLGRVVPAPIEFKFTVWLAGLWSHSLQRDLLWRVVDYDDEQDDRDASPRTRRPRKWRAPSWSWASVIGPVEFLDQTEGMVESEPRCEIIDFFYCYRGKASFFGTRAFGELENVEGGHFLALKGSLLPAVASVKGPISSDSRGKRKKGWEIMDLDIFNGHLKNVWVDDVAHWLGKDDDHASQQGYHQVSCFLVGVKKTKALCFLILETLQEGQHGMTSVGLEAKDSTGQREQKTYNGTDCDGIQNLYQQVGVAEVFGGPPGPGSWTERLLGLGHDQVLKIF